ncbi:MAG TPA: universal stress protein [Planctomycetota bacterium]|nr:universal stress protein [Planctomycetota bacterium]
MITTRHILLPTDMSEQSIRIFGPVASLARALDARITLLCVIHDQVHVPGPPGAPIPTTLDVAETARAARHRLRDLRTGLPADLQVDVDTAARFDIGRAIVEYAAEHGIDYITMATHGRSGLRRLVLGSVTESVLRQSTVPLVVFPGQA